MNYTIPSVPDLHGFISHEGTKNSIIHREVYEGHEKARRKLTSNVQLRTMNIELRS